MKTTSVVFETEDYDEIMFKALKGAVVDCSVDIKNADGTFKETSVRLSAREAKAVGQALIAIAEASLTEGIEDE